MLASKIESSTAGRQSSERQFLFTSLILKLVKKARDTRPSIFFFNQVQTPVTLCNGELWSILVVRLAHSADLRSRLRHVSSAPSVAYSTGCSRVVTHPRTNPAQRCLS